MYLELLGQKYDVTDAAAVQAAMRAAVEKWGQRSGVAATRIVLVVEKTADQKAAAALRTSALAAHNWRVVVLAKEAGHVMEVHLNPPRAR